MVRKIEAIYSLGTGVIVVFIGAPLSDTLLPVFCMSIIAATCIVQVIVDIRRHPFHLEYIFDL